MGERADGGDEGPGEAEVGDFEATLLGDQEVLRLQVPVHDAAGMAEGEAVKDLEEEGFDHAPGERPWLGLHVLFQVPVHELEDEVEAALALNAVQEPG